MVDARFATAASLLDDYDRPHTPGAFVAVVQGDAIIYQRGYGRANLEFDVPWTDHTRYRIASLTKQFVGTAMLLLEDEGTLSLEDEVHRHLPELPAYGHPIALRHMLQMTSGLMNDEIVASIFTGDTGLHSLDYLFAIVTRIPALNNAPGDWFIYSDTNYRLAARIIERVTGQPFATVLRERIFAPLGMDDTFASPFYAEAAPRQAVLYDPVAPGTFHRIQEGIDMSGDGAIVSTVADLLRWNAHLRYGLLGGPALLRRWSTPGVLTGGRETAYGLGIRVASHRGRRTWSHSGLFGAHLLRFIDDDLTIVVFANRTDLSARSIALRAADAILFPDAQGASDTADASATAGDDALARATGRYLHHESGSLLDLSIADGVPRATFLGLTRPLRPAGDGSYVDAVDGALTVALSPPASSAARPSLHADIGLGAPAPFMPLPSEPRALSPDALHAYVGEYENQVLEMRQRIVLRDGCLVLQLDRGQSPAHLRTLIPAAADVFIAPSPAAGYRADDLHMRFVRDTNGAIAAIRESVDSARGIVFERRV